MTALGPIVIQQGSPFPCTVLREIDEWGLCSLDLVAPPRRLWGDDERPKPTVESGVDARRVRSISTPSQVLKQLPEQDNWSAQSKRSIARLSAYFLIAEDPQRRLDAREVSTLAHQVSLVRHILDNGNLRRVLIADEVGLGKTVEAGLLIKELLEQTPSLRVLYLAPARLVKNVRIEFERLGLFFRQWTANDADARLTDSRIIASIHRAVHGENRTRVTSTSSWDVLVVDECHHLSDWAPGGGDPKEKFKLVRDLIARQNDDSRVILLSGTPHQGHVSRFENLLGLLRSKNEAEEALSGRVIYRTKDEIRDWSGSLLFPRRRVNEPIVVDLGPQYRSWLQDIHAFYRPAPDVRVPNQSWRRAAGWRCAQALQWAASSPHAGLGYLVRQAMRAGWTEDDVLLRDCLSALRPYRGGAEDESIPKLFMRIWNEIQRQRNDADIDDIEEDDVTDQDAARDGLAHLLAQGLAILTSAANAKWDTIWNDILVPAGDEKVVLFAQPIETVTALARYLARRTGSPPALIIGGQSDGERDNEVNRFRRHDGPQFLVSSRAGGEGINLQIAHRLVHIDVPWNPMELEQRVGRVHRFGSRRTIVVDTIVVKDSREADAYRIARQKLRLIASTMVDAERFESVFSRVMCLMPPDALQDVLINDALSPIGREDQERIARMVREGFETWSDFDRRFADQQRQIRELDPGLATWEDVSDFVANNLSAQRLDGFVSQRFNWQDGEVVAANQTAEVWRLEDGRDYACGDYQGAPVFGPKGETVQQLGLNLAAVSSSIRRLSLPEAASGAAHLRWASSQDMPAPLTSEPLFGVLCFLRQTINTDSQAGWVEGGVSLHTYGVCQSGSAVRILEGLDRRRLIDGLLAATIRIKPEETPVLIDSMVERELQIGNELRRPSDLELERGIRHAVTPIFAAIISTS